MGMGYSGVSTDTVKDSFVKKIVGKSLFDKFKDLVMEMSQSDIFEILTCENYVEEGEEHYELCNVYKKLKEKFDSTTGLELVYNYHDPEDGSRYDGVSGAFWSVDGVYMLSPAGKKYKNEITSATYVQFG